MNKRWVWIYCDELWCYLFVWCSAYTATRNLARRPDHCFVNEPGQHRYRDILWVLSWQSIFVNLLNQKYYQYTEIFGPLWCFLFKLSSLLLKIKFPETNVSNTQWAPHLWLSLDQHKSSLITDWTIVGGKKILIKRNLILLVINQIYEHEIKVQKFNVIVFKMYCY